MGLPTSVHKARGIEAPSVLSPFLVIQVSPSLMNFRSLRIIPPLPARIGLVLLDLGAAHEGRRVSVHDGGGGSNE